MNPSSVEIIKIIIGVPVMIVTLTGVLGFIVYRLYPFFDMLSKRADEQRKYISNPFWPKINTVETAKIVARNTSEITFLIAGITTVYTIFKIQSVSYLAIFDISVLIVIGFFIRKMSRIAAIIGFCLYISSKIVTFMKFPFIGSTAFLIIFMLAFINGIRATFNYHRLINDDPTS